MTVDFMYRLVLRILAKNAQQGYVSPEDFNDNINQAQISFTDYLLGQFQQYQVGRPVARVDYSMNEKARQRLTPLIQTPVERIVDPAGLCLYPDDFQQVDAMFTESMNRMRYVPQHKLYSYLNSRIDPVATNPIWLIESTGFRIYPNQTSDPVNGLTQLKLSYVQTPPEIIWAFTEDSNGLPEYTPTGSQDPVWYDVDCLEIISRALRLFGVEMEDSAVLQFANQTTGQGQ